MKKFWIFLIIIAIAVGLYFWLKRKSGWNKPSGTNATSTTGTTGTEAQGTSSQPTGPKTKTEFKQKTTTITPKPEVRTKPIAKLD